MSAQLLSELKRRRVFRALIGYGIGAFALLQIIEPVMHGLHWPEAVLSYVVVALAIGFPICVTVAWIFDVNEGRVERTAGGGPTGARLALVLIGIGALAAMPGLLWYFVVRAGERATAGDTRVPSIAVLPFANLSGKPENEYFSDGIAEEILDELAQVDGLRVVGRTSSFSFKGKAEDLRDIGQKLSVAHVLEGSVRKEGNRVRVTAQLVGTADGYHLWSKTFDRELTGVFAVQDEISRAVVAALKVRLMPGQEPRQRTASNPEVYNEYLLGKDFFHRQQGENLRRAVAAYERALALDPRFAPAWAGLALATFWLASTGETPAAVVEGYQRALAAAEKAVAADPGLADGYAARGLLRSWIQWNWDGARADCERALALNPGDPASHLSYERAVLMPLGRVPEAIAEGQKATDLDPLSAEAWLSVGVPSWMSGQLGTAQAALERSLHIFPDQDYAAVLLAVTKLFQKKPAEALAAAELSRQDLFRKMGTALALNDLGRTDEAHRLVEQMIAGYAHAGAYNIAQSYAWFGDRDLAFAWLQRAYEQHDWLLASFLKADPLLRGLRGDPRLALILKKMNLPPD